MQVGVCLYGPRRTMVCNGPGIVCRKPDIRVNNTTCGNCGDWPRSLVVACWYVSCVQPSRFWRATENLPDELLKDASASQLNSAHISQPAVTAIQIALTAMLASWNIIPSTVMGHSSGEIAASYAAGILSLESAMKVAYFRGQVTNDFKSLFPKIKGAMMAVGCNEAQLQSMLESVASGKIVVAAVNGPRSLTVSGDEQAILELQHIVDEKGVFNRKLRVDMAYHSYHMELIAERYLSLLHNISPAEVPGVEFYSTVTGARISCLELQPAYWVSNLVSQVKFSEALISMCGGSDSISTIIEVGPHAALEGPILQTLKEHSESYKAINYTSCLRRDTDANDTSIQLAAFLCMRGYPLNTAAVNNPLGHKESKTLIDMPPYRWQHDKKYWHESRLTQNHLFKAMPRHDLLGLLADDINDSDVEWRNVLRLSEVPWVEQHRVQSSCVFPFAGYVGMAMEAMRQRALGRNLSYDSFILRDIAVDRPMTIESTTNVEIRTTLRPHTQADSTSTGIWEELRVHSWTKANGWLEHCRCLISVKQTNKENPVNGARRLQDDRCWIESEKSLISQSCCTEIDLTAMYSDLDAVGFTFGKTYREMKHCEASPGHAIAQVSAPNTAELMPVESESEYHLHPITFDIITQVLWPCIGAGRTGLNSLYLPTFIKELEVAKQLPDTSKVPFEVFGRSPALGTKVEALSCSYFVMHPDAGDFPCLRAEGHTLTPVQDESSLPADDDPGGLCYRLLWEPSSPLDLKKTVETTRNSSSHINGSAHTNSSPHINGSPLTNGSPHINGSPHTNGLMPSVPQDVAIVTLDGSRLSKIVDTYKLSDALADSTGKLPLLKPLHGTSFEGMIVIILIELDRPCLSNLQIDTLGVIKSIISNADAIIWPVRSAYEVSKSPELNMISGFARTIRAETGMKFITIDLDQESSPSDVAETIAEVFSRAFGRESTQAAEMEYMERSGNLYVPRLTPAVGLDNFIHRNANTGVASAYPQSFVQGSRPMRLTIERPGSLDSMYFVDDTQIIAPIGNDEIEIEVKAISLNFKDVVMAMGQLPGKLIGQECSGIVSRTGELTTEIKVGDRVCAFSAGCIANHARCRASSSICIPEDMPFDLAATLPIVYCTAYYSLIDIGRLSSGDKILIHAAAGGVGQAALGIAQMIGAEVFATVGSEPKKSFLMENFGIDEDHIFYSRDTSFKTDILRMTNNRGVDVILNSLSGNVLEATLECLAPFGRFIEIGKRDISENTKLGMALFARSVIFAAVDLATIAADRPLLMQKLLKDVLDLYRQDRLRLVSPLETLPISEVQSAIRALQRGETIGKLVIVPNPDDQIMVSTSLSVL